jgi:predicted nuclease with RNAse H fold
MMMAAPGPTTIVGIDCAASWKNVGLAFGRFADGRLTIEDATCGNRNPVTVVAARLAGVRSAVIALDAPLGWPVPMVDALGGHSAGAALAGDRKTFFNRTTDLEIRRRFGKKPLEVGANLIAHTAFSAIAILNELRAALGTEIPLAWAAGVPGSVVAIEVYPAVTRIGHGIACEGNRLSNLPGSVSLPDALSTDCGVDHVRDAVLCAIAAADFCAGTAVPPKDLPLARREGWIWAHNEAPSKSALTPL